MTKNALVLLLTPTLIFSLPMTGFAEDKPVSLEISGHFKLYGNYAHQDVPGVRKTDILRDVDVTFSGETALSNGLTVGALVNADGDGGDGFAVEDSFVYAAGKWGRLSLGMEDGAAFMLQVAAPSANDDVDGLETFVSPFSFATSALAGTHFETDVSAHGLDYDNDLTAGIDKLTYLTPVIGGFQAGVSYTPDVANFDPASRSLNGNNPDHALDEYGDAWEVGARYERKISDAVSYIAGAGYTSVNTEQTNASSTIDTFKEWNTALDFDIGAYGIGAVYTENNGGAVRDNDSKTWVVGTDYTIGPVKYGASWLSNSHQESATATIRTNRVTGGVVYEYGPGLTFRGTVSHVNTDAPASIGEGTRGTAVTLGTQILF